MKKLMLALTLSVFSIVPAFAVEAEEMNVETSSSVVELEEGDFAKIDDRIFCSVAMVNRARRVVVRYNGRRNLRTWRCEGPMRQCRRDLGWRRIRGARCVELR